jgi:4-hydroxyproline epimerase
MKRVHVVDSHTEGEPTRLVVEGGPDLGEGELTDRRERFRRDHDAFRRALLTEPRASPAAVGALLVPPTTPLRTAGFIFFNNSGYLGMCGHGAIGALVSLEFLGRIRPGEHELETPAGLVRAELRTGGSVTFENVPARRSQSSLALEVPGVGRVVGDIAWGGNWFFIARESPIPLRSDRAADLTEYAGAIRSELERRQIRGDDGAPIDHIEIEGPAERPDNQGRNFVLCPGGMYDRSPCGTGTSAKLACLAADGRLREGELWRQEGILGGVFEARYSLRDGAVIPSITGSAHITGEADLIFDEADPFCWGIPG